MKKFLSLFIFFFFSFAFAQNPVNAYAKIVAVSGGNLVVTNVDEQYDSFEDGDKIIVMQMQGASLSDYSNSATFGTVGNIASAGSYEICTITSHTENAGVPDTLKISTPLQNNYDFSSTVQAISFPTLGGGSSFTTTNDIVAKAFDGLTGGLVCFEVQGNLYLQHNISADGKGFRGGAKTPSGVGGACDETLYAVPFSNDAAMKGEGIFTNPLALAGRAPAVNGGGGGVQHNGGGGGGANYSAGGYGGIGYVHKCTTMVAGGLGGQDLQWYITPDRIFMGGGGGGGHDNDGFGTSGASGGGIIILKCDSLISNGSCTAVTISANGLNAANDAQDGKGGGGAGGSILFDVQHVKSNTTCPLKITANGGNGGSVTVSKQHAGGGGGGQGVIMLLCGGSEQSVAFETLNGKGGKNETSFTPTYAGNGAGVNNTAIFIGIPSDTLPAIFSSLTATQDSFKMIVDWTTTFEKNVANFQLQHSAGGGPWQTITTVAGHGPGIFSGTFNYSYTHTSPLEGMNYYRLLINDTLGCSFYSPYWAGVYTEPVYEEEISIYPNPVKDDFIIRSNYAFEDSWFKVYDARGREVNAIFTMITEKKYKVYAPSLAQGVYFVRYLANKKKGIIKFLVWN